MKRSSDRYEEREPVFESVGHFMCWLIGTITLVVLFIHYFGWMIVD